MRKERKKICHIIEGNGISMRTVQQQQKIDKRHVLHTPIGLYIMSKNGIRVRTIKESLVALHIQRRHKIDNGCTEYTFLWGLAMKLAF